MTDRICRVCAVSWSTAIDGTKCWVCGREGEYGTLWVSSGPNVAQTWPEMTMEQIASLMGIG
jgi:hypothetical protein